MVNDIKFELKKVLIWIKKFNIDFNKIPNKIINFVLKKKKNLIMILL